MGDTSYRFAGSMTLLKSGHRPRRAKFTHIRGLVIDEEKYRKAYLAPDRPNVEHFQILTGGSTDESEGIVADLIPAADTIISRVFPNANSASDI